MRVPPDQVLRRADVLWRSTLDGVLVRPVGTGEVVVLAGTGAALWAALEEPTDFADVCCALAAMHDADIARVAQDLTPVIVDLIERRVVAGT